MPRYIDADKLKEECYKFANDVSRSAMAFVQGQINAAPTANVAPIADTVRKMVDRLDKHFCHDPAFLGVEQRMIMAIIDRIAREIVVEIQNETN